ncbi:CBS domain-containing protein [uncultured Clostridium sp.]|uniref:magnesium transporter n=1 Tax=uncultured Clostridium sp. TaxID=59620 RepID=UPI0025D70F24|nr:CBS domain-containing protein [uncultured Clostridium sp.]
MEKLYNFFFSKVYKRKVYNEYNDCIGILHDMFVMNDGGYPKIIGYQIKNEGEISSCVFRNIEFYRDMDKKITIKIRGQRDIIPNSYSYLLSKHLLYKKIVDVNGKKLVRVNDVRLASIAGDIRVVAVDPGFKGLARRYGFYKILKMAYKLIKKIPEDQLIMWDNVEALDIVLDNLKLNVPYKKLSKLHPADLADILEEMDSAYRNKIFESLDEDLAADTLEEIEPEFQAELLGNLSGDKRATVLSNIPNDELADMLDEVDDETAEKILYNMEKEDADEIRSLMEYEEELVGSMMNKDFIAFNVNITAKEALDIIKEVNPEEEVIYYVYITDEEEKFKGMISFKDLVFAKEDTMLKDIMKDEMLTVKDSDKVETAIDAVNKYNLLSIPVIDAEDKLCGIIVLHDLLDEILVPSYKKRFKRVS